MYQEQRQQYVSKSHDIAKRNEVLLEQLRISQNASAVKQEQQLDNLVGTLHMLQNRIQTIAPRFEEIDELKKNNQSLQSRIDRLIQQNANNSLPKGMEDTLVSLHRRIG